MVVFDQLIVLLFPEEGPFRGLFSSSIFNKLGLHGDKKVGVDRPLILLF